MRSMQELKLCGRVAVACWLIAGVASGDDFSWEPSAVSQNWESAVNWAGPLNEIPDGDDDTALVQGINNDDPMLTESRAVGALSIRQGGQVYTGDGINNFKLAVRNTGPHSGTTLIENFLSWLVVENSPLVDDFDTQNLVINSGGTLFINDGAQSRVRNVVDVNAGGLVSGSGLLQINGATPAKNDGIIQAAGGTLTVTRTGAATFDWDGDNENGSLRATNGAMLVMDMPGTGPFNGTMTVDQDAAIEFGFAVDLGVGSVLNFNGGSGTATLQGGTVNLSSTQATINSGTAVFASPTSIGPSSDLVVNDGTSVQFDAPTTFFTPASISHLGTTTWIVNDVVEIGNGAANFDWDGTSGNSTTIVNQGGELRIDVEAVDLGGSPEEFGGTLVINGSIVDVRNGDGQWEMAGNLQFNRLIGTVPVLSGDGVLITGSVDVAGGGASRFNASTTFAAGSSTEVAANTTLRMANPLTVFSGGSFSGEGGIDLDGTVTSVTAPTTVNMPNGTFDVDGSQLGDTVSLNSQLTLNVNALDDFDNNIDDTVSINGAAGRLNVQLTDPNDSYAIRGELNLNGPGGGFNAIQLAGSDVELAGTTNVSGNSTQQARVTFSGTTVIAAAGELNLQGGSANEPNRILDSASFSGPGDLNVLAAGALQIEDGAAVGVDVRNAGRLEPGPGRETINLGGNFLQETSGVLAMEIAAAPGVDQDRVNVDGIASLAGDVEVSFVEGFVPSIGDVFTLVASGTRLGTFDSLMVNTPAALEVNAVLTYSARSAFVQINDVSLFGDFNDDLGLDCADVDALVAEIAGGGMDPQFDLNGDAAVNQLDLQLWLDEAGTFNVGGPYIAGDANLDGTVDVSDFNIWNGNKFTSTGAWCLGDFNADGITDVSDFNVWNANKFSTSLSTVPEPAGMGWGILAAILLALRLRSPGKERC